MDIQHRSLWSEFELPRTTPLGKDVEVDVAVVGAGMTGLMSALFLAEAGRRVAVLERYRIASGDTGATTSHLTMVTDARLHDLAASLGRDSAREVWGAGRWAIDRIEGIAASHRMNAHFRRVDGFLHLSPGKVDEEGREVLEKERSLARELGFEAELVESAPIFGTPAVRFPGQGRIHPIAFLAELGRLLTAMGVHIYEESEVEEFDEDPLALRANGYRVSCADIVVATHTPLQGLQGLLEGAFAQSKLALYSSYVVAGRMPKGSIPDALWWDTEDPYNYLRIEPGEEFDTAIYGGADHKTGQEEETGERYKRLAARARRILPGIELTHRWSGQVILTPDGLPYIGEAAPHQYAATGYVGNGITLGTVGAAVISDAILGRENRWASTFAFDRAPIGRESWEYLQENADYPYHLVRDRLRGPEARPPAALPPGDGAIVTFAGKKVAASRAADGTLSLLSPVCTHMGCIVAWNGAERTWDCPCHGSRFAPDGSVISGPAESPLAEIDLTT